MQDFRQALYAKPRTAEGFLHLLLCEQPESMSFGSTLDPTLRTNQILELESRNRPKREGPTRVVPSHGPYSLLDALKRLATPLHRLGGTSGSSVCRAL